MAGWKHGWDFMHHNGRSFGPLLFCFFPTFFPLFSFFISLFLFIQFNVVVLTVCVLVVFFLFAFFSPMGGVSTCDFVSPWLGGAFCEGREEMIKSEREDEMRCGGDGMGS